ncbi:GNAT family N-acetyltransferase [Streptomyces drozdowiczii]|uniref:GNAT family N-acetyltransferase n=1 Tax=Streptomyces drozdowiczii TaxID=202862 RepID=A0ABY6PNV9_9ACTN|nr:GNAT family N-acetyltransferase [Streptomyces drozdowiczii]MCX0247123.1 GNAT family N-acetyltransferase [Streptomyces drozdowiczii]UZK53446.1 GNAT family N-acetyltransferase [Streptomyces drozdowiczii]
MNDHVTSDPARLLALFDRVMREEARPEAPGLRVERAGDVVRQVGAAHGWNGVVWSAPDLDAARADAAVAEQVAYCERAGCDAFEWKLYGHDRPADLGARLLAAGFKAEEPETLLVARVAELATAVRMPEGVRLEEVRDEAGAELMARANERAFGRDGSWLRRLVLERLREDPEHFVALVAMAGDEPVSSARMELYAGTGFAGLWGGGTDPAWRGRGVYRALVAFRAGVAAERGYDYLQVDATEDSRPILERLGFTALTTTTPYIYRPTPS